MFMMLKCEDEMQISSSYSMYIFLENKHLFIQHTLTMSLTL